jgi:hypothetical protein
MAEMSDDDEIEHVTEIERGKPSHVNMDEAFRVRMLKAIAAGLENAPIGVVTTPGTKKPKYVLTEVRPLTSSSGDMNF